MARLTTARVRIRIALAAGGLSVIGPRHALAAIAALGAAVGCAEIAGLGDSPSIVLPAKHDAGADEAVETIDATALRSAVAPFAIATGAMVGCGRPSPTC